MRLDALAAKLALQRAGKSILSRSAVTVALAGFGPAGNPHVAAELAELEDEAVRREWRRHLILDRPRRAAPGGRLAATLAAAGRRWETRSVTAFPTPKRGPAGVAAPAGQVPEIPADTR